MSTCPVALPLTLLLPVCQFASFLLTVDPWLFFHMYVFLVEPIFNPSCAPGTSQVGGCRVVNPRNPYGRVQPGSRRGLPSNRATIPHTKYVCREGKSCQGHRSPFMRIEGKRTDGDPPLPPPPGWGVVRPDQGGPRPLINTWEKIISGD